MMHSHKDDGPNGCFVVRTLTRKLYCIASNGAGWEHVSVHGVYPSSGSEFTPSWEDMCLIKQLFWEDEDCVLQYHPRKSQYVNCHPHTLHLWRPVNAEIPEPETILIGPK